MRFMVYYKHVPEVKEKFTKLIGKTYGKGIKVASLKEAAVLTTDTGEVMPCYVVLLKGSLLRYLQSKKLCGKYATHRIGWKLK